VYQHLQVRNKLHRLLRVVYRIRQAVAVVR
jgi:hypothetical protein